MNASDIASKAASLVGGDRERTHGDKKINFNNIAKLWTAWFAINVSPMVTLDGGDVSELMELLKIARRSSGEYNVDDYVDTAGYAACTGELRAPVETRR